MAPYVGARHTSLTQSAMEAETYGQMVEHGLGTRG
jgi:hypothetical protein